MSRFLPKERRRLLQREILGHLWRGRTAEAVWILWGLQSSARVPERIDALIGYLLRKQSRCWWGVSAIRRLKPAVIDIASLQGDSEVRQLGIYVV
ncbi:MAG: hypothetical protein LBI05_10740 [Planctomycetaceae bacterium]|nr:hypothetical protein [Planctomycetaceae bacterium]